MCFTGVRRSRSAAAICLGSHTVRVACCLGGYVGIGRDGRCGGWPSGAFTGRWVW